MSCEHFQKPYKQRFKGVESFLRRVAFNLGNTPSQTEVKIVSCIPIDVTDLQQKIINLEKQLLEAQQQGRTVVEKVPEIAKDKPSAVVSTALYGSSFGKQSSTVSYCSNKPIDQMKSQVKKSNVSFLFSALSAPDRERSCNFSTHKNCSNQSAAAIERCKNIFRKRKRKKDFKGNNKMKTHLVYYAHQTDDNPFKTNNVPLKYRNILSDSDECVAHLNNVIRRQYDPNEFVEEYSDTSHFSRPICRDVGNKHAHYESDVCSCYHDNFQNIDDYMTKNDYDSIITKLHNTIDTTDAYYDAKNYDLIPVKENNNKVIKSKGQKKENKLNVEIKCWPERLRTKYRYHPFNVYQTEIPVKRRSNKKSQEIYRSEKTKPNKLLINKDKVKKSDQQMAMESSKSCCIDCSDIYPKQNPNRKIEVESRRNEILKTIIHKNESVATDDINKLQVTNQSTQLELNITEDCRDVTLDEIKTILQSVLEEVKTNTKLNNAEEVIKKDAVVQNGASQNSMPGESTFLHSYTYNNSYNRPCFASCSKQTPHGQYCLASNYQPVKCLQNFPVFIQPTPGRHLCACYYKKCSSGPQGKCAAAATNTEKDIEISSSKETEKLIKEIYKSITLNVDYPTKDSSMSEYNDLKSENVSANIIDKNNKDVTNETIIKVEAMVSPIQSIMNQTKSEYVSANKRSGYRNQDVKPFNKIESKANVNKDKYVHRLEVHNIRSSATIAEDNEETDEFSDESDSEGTVIVEEELKQDKKPRKGFFNRMFKSVKLFQKKKTREEIDASDSEDYETIYSEKSAKSKSYQKARAYTKHFENGTKRLPYLEQEYRRRWNENLLFNEQSKCSSEQPASRFSNSQPARPIYWNNYETRSVMVDQKLPNKVNPSNATKNIQQNTVEKNNKNGQGWLKKHRLGINCGKQWKKFILEN